MKGSCKKLNAGIKRTRNQDAPQFYLRLSQHVQATRSTLRCLGPHRTGKKSKKQSSRAHSTLRALITDLCNLYARYSTMELDWYMALLSINTSHQYPDAVAMLPTLPRLAVLVSLVLRQHKAVSFSRDLTHHHPSCPRILLVPRRARTMK